MVIRDHPADPLMRLDQQPHFDPVASIIEEAGFRSPRTKQSEIMSFSRSPDQSQ